MIVPAPPVSVSVSVTVIAGAFVKLDSVPMVTAPEPLKVRLVMASVELVSVPAMMTPVPLTFTVLAPKMPACLATTEPFVIFIVPVKPLLSPPSVSAPEPYWLIVPLPASALSTVMALDRLKTRVALLVTGPVPSVPVVLLVPTHTAPDSMISGPLKVFTARRAIVPAPCLCIPPRSPAALPWGPKIALVIKSAFPDAVVSSILKT